MNHEGEKARRIVREARVRGNNGNCLSPGALGTLAKQLAAATDPIEAASIKEQLTRGFYGVDGDTPLT